jgi:co-chaperonin GroES (HSP10)
MNNGGDLLARGAKSAQFQAGGTDFSEIEYDLRVRREIVAEKYGLSAEEIAAYDEKIANNERFSLPTLAEREEELSAGITVTDKRRSFEDSYAGGNPDAKPVAVAKKWPEKNYTSATPILDRILVKRCADGPDMQIMDDGSVLNKKTGLVIAAKYRQHSNIGIVLAVGQFVIIGGQRVPMADVVRVGDRVTYGDYNSEVFLMDDAKVEALCDAVQMNYEADPEGLRIVRVQDVRLVEREGIATLPELEGNNV